MVLENGTAIIAAAIVLAVVLYTRLSCNRAFQNGMRWKIYEHIKQNPGTHYNALKTALDLKNGTLSHHLRMLELLGHIKSVRNGRHLRFCTQDGGRCDDIAMRCSPVQAGILNALQDMPGLNMSELAKALGRPVSVIAYNIDSLGRLGLVRVERGKGVRLLCYANRAA
jgi:predicted transcriptional regulator